jgi:hypothetical protein
MLGLSPVAGLAKEESVASWPGQLLGKISQFLLFKIYLIFCGNETPTT